MANIFTDISNGIGRVLGTDNNDQIDAAQQTLQGINTRANQVSAQNRGIYDDYWNQMRGMYGENAGKYGDAVNQLADAIANRNDFEYSGNIEDFLNPAMEMRQRQAAQQLNAAASSGGSRFSSNYQDKLMAQSQGIAAEQWEKAFDKMMQDRAAQLQQWQTGQQKIQNLGTLAGLYGNDRQGLADAMGNYYSNLANQNNADLEVYSDVAQNSANLDAQRKQGIGAALGPIAQFTSAFFK